MKVKKVITKRPQASGNLTKTLIRIKDKLDKIKNRDPEFTHHQIAKELEVSDSLISHVLRGKVKSKWLVTQLKKIIESKP